MMSEWPGHMTMTFFLFERNDHDIFVATPIQPGFTHACGGTSVCSLDSLFETVNEIASELVCFPIRETRLARYPAASIIPVRSWIDLPGTVRVWTKQTSHMCMASYVAIDIMYSTYACMFIRCVLGRRRRIVWWVLGGADSHYT